MHDIIIQRTTAKRQTAGHRQGLLQRETQLCSRHLHSRGEAAVDIDKINVTDTQPSQFQRP